MPKNLPVELIYLLIAAAVLIFNYVTGQAAKRRKSEAPPEEPPEAEAPEDAALPPIWGRTQQTDAPSDDPLPPIWGRTPSVPATVPAPVRAPAAVAESARRSRAPTTFPARANRRYSRQSLLGTRREVQNAIVIATIVGPCRAFKPHDIE